MNFIDKKILQIADKYWKHLALAALFILSFVLRITIQVSGDALDWGAYLKPWITQYRLLGLKGLGTVIGDYYVPYNIILALIAQTPFPEEILVPFVTYLFELGMAYEIYLLSRELFHRSPINAALTAALLLFLPITFLNNFYWKQCDAIFTFFTLAGIRHLLNNHPNRGMIMIGLAFSFKLQAIFILPFCCYLYFKKRNIPVLSFLWIPGIFLLSGLPAILLGRSVTSTYGTYLTQVHSSRIMSINAANIWALAPNALELYDAALLLCFALLLAAFIFLYSREQDNIKLLNLATWTILTCFLFLPSMHERYDFAGLIFLYLCATGNHLLFISVCLMHGASTLTYLQYLQGAGYCMPVLSIAYFAGYLLFTFTLLDARFQHTVSTETRQKA